MKLAVKISSLLVLALAGISAAGAQGNVVNEMGKPPGNFPIPSNAKLELSLKTDKKKYADTDLIKINFTVKNKGKEEATISLTTAQERECGGKVVGVSVVVGEDGSLKSRRVISSASADCDAIAIEAVTRYRYKAARDEKGRPVEGRFALSIRF